MNLENSDAKDRDRCNIAVEFKSVRVFECGGQQVRRLLAADDQEEEFPLLVSPEYGPLMGLMTGKTYELCGVLRRDLQSASTEVGPAWEQRATALLDISGVYGIVDEVTTIRPI